MSEEPVNDTVAPVGAGPMIPDAAKGLRAPRAAAIAGLAFGVLYVLSTFVLTIRPPGDTNPAAFAAWYRTSAVNTITIVALYLTPLTGIAFLWFVAVIRNRVGEREDRFFATVFLGSGLLFVAMIWAAGATIGSLVAPNRVGIATVPDPVTFDLVRSLAHTFFQVYATRAAAIFVIVTSTIALGTGAFPRWLIVLGYVIALVQFVSTGQVEAAVLLFPAWVMILSVSILVGEVRVRRV